MKSKVILMLLFTILFVGSCDQLQTILEEQGDPDWEWDEHPVVITSSSQTYYYEIDRGATKPKVSSAVWKLKDSSNITKKEGTLSQKDEQKSYSFEVNYTGCSNGTYTLEVTITYEDNTQEVLSLQITVNITGNEETGENTGDTGGTTSYLYQENFEYVTLSTNNSAQYWFKPSVNTGTVQVVTDPTGSGKGKVLELKDQNTNTYDWGAVCYSPVIEPLKDANIGGKTLELDFYFNSDTTGRWFMLAKTHQQAFIMHDPNDRVDAYASSTHSYITVPLNKWLTLKVVFASTSYSVYVYDGATELGRIESKPNNSESYDTYPQFLGSSVAGDGRLYFGSWFVQTSDTSYGHTYIDNIRVY